MDVGRLISNGRLTLAAYLSDTCTITRAAGDLANVAVNESTGAVIPGGPSTVYTGSCRVSGPAARLVDEAGARVELGGYRALVPFDAPLARVGDVFTVTASTYDPSLVGVTFGVSEVGLASDVLLRRLELQTEAAAVPRAGGR